MEFVAANDNKVGIKYDESRDTIGSGDCARVLSTRTQDAADLIRDAALNDRVALRVVGDVGAKIRILGFTSPGVQFIAFGSVSGENFYIKHVSNKPLTRTKTPNFDDELILSYIVISPRKQALTDKRCKLMRGVAWQTFSTPPQKQTIDAYFFKPHWLLLCPMWTTG
ncbi:hypothetical protein Leryth_011810 [Lithospermum erythrorhizon]|nr:hypothetical protein Leryth_011810 [Lithospermum erythrorhizon]